MSKPEIRPLDIAIERANEAIHKLCSENDSLKAELEAARPLLEAVMAEGEFNVMGETSQVAHRVIQAVVAYRAKKV